MMLDGKPRLTYLSANLASVSEFSSCNPVMGDGSNSHKVITNKQSGLSLMHPPTSPQLLDRISNLPDCMICCILEKLSLRDRVRTSALSQSWRYRWTQLPSLPIDFHLYYDSSRRLRRLYETGSSQHATTVDSIVSQYRSCVRELSLFMPDRSLHNIESTASLYHHSISRVITSSSSSIQKLCLERFYDMEQVSLPCCIFTAVNLRHLRIKCFNFCPPSSFKGFPHLTHLVLVDKVATAGTISRFVSVCPQLEEITMQNIKFIEDVDLMTPKLRHLYVEGFFKNISIPSTENLESVKFCLRKFHVGVDSLGGSYNQVRLFQSAVQLQQLCLEGNLCKILGSSSLIQMLPTFIQMDKLKFRCVCLGDADVLQCVLSFIAASPNVNKLVLTEEQHYGVCSVRVPVEKCISHDFKHLVSIYLTPFTGTETEMKMIEVLLHHSPVLEMMSIHFPFSFSKDEKLRLIDNVISFHRASTQVVKFEFLQTGLEDLRRAIRICEVREGALCYITQEV